ncbi:hypothetical protein JCM19992_08480 [Thermostilla marina]
MRSLISTVLSVSIAVFAVVGTASASPVWITTEDGQGADAFVQGGATAETNFGSIENVVVKNGPFNDQFARKGYLRFDLGQTLGGPISAATLALTVTANNSGGGNPAPANFTVDVFGLVDGFAGVDNTANSSTADDADVHDEFWPENLIDWNSAPANVTSSGFDLDANALLLGSLAVTTGDVVGTTVFFSTPELVDFLNDDTNGVVTLILRRSGATAGNGPNLAFASKENSVYAAPTLLLDANLPEPSAWLLGLLAVPGLVYLRRRRK